MSWLTELLQLQRVRRTFIRFAQDLNPDGPWVGALDRRYGSTDDGRGTVKIKGTVDRFGTFTNRLANHEFTIEVPSISTSLFDPDNEWRALSDRPSNQLMQRRIGYYVRQEDTAGNILDQRIAVGQINGTPRFPVGRMDLNLNVPGGDFLGEDVPRRLLNTKDWPRALPDDIGKVIPLPYGKLNNRAPHVVVTTTPGGGDACDDCLVSHWGGSPTLLLGMDDLESYGGSTAALSAAGYITSGTPLTNERAYSGTWSARQSGSGLAHSLTPTSTVLLFGVQVFWPASSPIPNAEGLINFTTTTTHDGFNAQCRLVQLSGGELRLIRGSSIDIVATSPNLMVLDAWNCITGAFDISNSGAYRVYVNGTLAMEGTADLTGAFGGFQTVGGATWGLYGGANIDNIWIAQSTADFGNVTFCDNDEPVVEPEETTTVECADTDGINDQGSAGRGGWLTCLLADTGGGTVGISDYPTVSGLTAVAQAMPHAAPTLSSATATSGGNGIPGTYYVAIATVHAGVLSDLSNVIAVTLSGGNLSITLAWTGLASGADHVRVYVGNDAGFSQFDRYRVSGNPYSENDVSASNTGVVIEWAGTDTRTQLDPDPHLDLNYPKYAFYQGSVLYDDGAQSACSDLVQVNLPPLNPPRDVLVSWSAPTPPAGKSIVAYVIRRYTQTYTFGMGPDREWTFNVGTTSFTDPLNDTTAVSSCATEAQTGQKPVYVAAGWTCKAIDEVFVLKPDPTSDNKEFVQVKMVEGTDYTQEIREVNGNRYHCLVFEEQQRSDTCQYYKVSCNLQGADYNADGTGDLIVNADDIFDHMMLNVVLNTYRSSVGTFAPPGGKWWTDVPYSPGLFDRSSVTVAKAVGMSRLGNSVGYLGSGAIIRVQPARQLIYDFLFSYDLELRQYLGVWSVKRFDAPNVNRGSLTAITDENGVGEGTFEPLMDDTKQVNLIPYFAGPVSGDGANGYLVSGERQDSVSIDYYRRVIRSEPIYLLWTQDAQTAFSVVSHYLFRLSTVLLGAEFDGPIWLYTLPPGTEVKFTHPSGLGPNGYVARVMRVLSSDLNLDDLTTHVVLRDVDYLVP